MRQALATLMTALALALAAGPALAADPSGDWTGVMHHRRGAMEFGIEVRPGPAGYQGIYRDITHELQPEPMVAVRAAAPAFRLDSPYGVFTFNWQASAGRWRGVWRDKTGVYAMTLRPGVIPPAPLISTIDKISLAVIAGLILLEAAGIARLLQLRRRRRLRARAAPA